MAGAATGRKRLGRYLLGGAIASGGMATVHVGRLLGPAGFARTVAVKRLFDTYARDAAFVAMFVDEARLASRIQNPHVIPVLDVVEGDGELALVMEYVHGASLAELMGREGERRLALPVVAAIVCGALEGLHAAHEARDEEGRPLGLIHRDFSPQNIVVGVDGVARVLDFGIAKAIGRLASTAEGVVKGKVRYMAPEQLSANVTSIASDLYAAGVVLWEALAGELLFVADTVGATIGMKLLGDIDPPSRRRPDVPAALDAIVLQALSAVPEARFATAREMAMAIESAVLIATPRQVGVCVAELAGTQLTERAAEVARVERANPEDLEDAAAAPAGTEVAPSLTGMEVTELAVVDAGVLATRRGRGRAVWIAAAGAALAAAALWMGAREPSTPSREPSAAGAAPSSAPSLIASAGAVPAPIASAAVAPAPIASAGVASRELPADASPAATAPEPARGARSAVSALAPLAGAPAARPPRATAAAASRCTPPYTVDAEGIRIPKPECL